MKRTSINPTDWGLAYHMDQGEVVERASRYLRFSGQVDLIADPTRELGLRVESPLDMASQITSSLANIDAILSRAEMTRANIVYLRFFTTDVDSFLENYNVYADWIAPAGIRPPQSLLGISRLALPELLVEIEAEAAA